MANTILVVCEHENGHFKSTAFELVGKAKALGADVVGIVFGDVEASQLGRVGLQKAWQVKGPDFQNYDTGPFVRAMQTAVEKLQPRAVLAPASPSCKDGMPRLAARIGAGLGSECTELRASGDKIVGRRPIYAGKALVDVNVASAVALFTVRPNSFPQPADAPTATEVVALDVAVTDADRAARVTGKEAPTTAVVDLTEADRIVSGGRSLKSAENFDKVIRPLAAALHATPGASRAAVDSGFAKHSEQVGQTGKVVNPNLYIACGISGAIQHLAGMRTSKVIVAINTDKDAPIFQHATYGIVGDLFEICPLLTDEFKRALG
jgi:electron transfer flavoprotein alpha subunit